MDKDVKNFLDAEENAEQLLVTLKQLHTEVTSYHTASGELETTRQQLCKLIESSERVVADTHDIIKRLQQIGGPEILKRIDIVKVKIDKLKIMFFGVGGLSIIGIIVGIVSLVR